MKFTLEYMLQLALDKREEFYSFADSGIEIVLENMKIIYGIWPGSSS